MVEPMVITTMERRKFVIGLGSLAAGSAAAMSTGAFSSAQAERDMTVDIVGDESAYLSLSAKSDYAEMNDDDVLEIDFSDNDRGQGLGTDSTYLFRDVFKIENQGNEDVTVLARVTDGNTMEVINFFATGGTALDDSDDHEGQALTWPPAEDDLDNLDDQYAPEIADEADGEDVENSSPTLGPGEDLYVGIDINTDGVNPDETGERDVDIIALDTDTE